MQEGLFLHAGVGVRLGRLRVVGFVASRSLGSLAGENLIDNQVSESLL